MPLQRSVKVIHYIFPLYPCIYSSYLLRNTDSSIVCRDICICVVVVLFCYIFSTIYYGITSCDLQLDNRRQELLAPLPIPFKKETLMCKKGQITVKC